MKCGEVMYDTGSGVAVSALPQFLHVKKMFVVFYFLYDL